MIKLISASSSFEDRVRAVVGGPLQARTLDTIQANLGYRCNMSCSHCHLSAGPFRSEMMSGECAEQLLRVLADSGIGTLDLTGGAPEFHPEFRMLVGEARKLGRRVIVRHNLTVAHEEGMTDLYGFLGKAGVEIVASLPCYLEDNVDGARGRGAFEKSIRSLQLLNASGFGRADEGKLPLNLVFNPRGAFLPPPQAKLEEDYRRELGNRHGITFNRLFTFANMPIGRFSEALDRAGTGGSYRRELSAAFNPSALDGVMCRSLISVDWQGRLYDCDFNQAVGLPVTEGVPRHLDEFDLERLASRPIALADHCYACTAGQGFTCQGAVCRAG